MKYKHVLNSQSYVIVEHTNDCYNATVYKNGCSHNLMTLNTDSKERLDEWLVNLKGLFKDER